MGGWVAVFGFAVRAVWATGDITARLIACVCRQYHNIMVLSLNVNSGSRSVFNGGGGGDVDACMRVCVRA